MKLLRKVPDFFGLLSALLIALIWIIMTAELVARNVFHSPILGVSEISIYLYLTAAYFGFSYTQMEKDTFVWSCCMTGWGSRPGGSLT